MTMDDHVITALNPASPEGEFFANLVDYLLMPDSPGDKALRAATAKRLAAERRASPDVSRGWLKLAEQGLRTRDLKESATGR